LWFEATKENQKLKIKMQNYKLKIKNDLATNGHEEKKTGVRSQNSEEKRPQHQFTAVA